MGDMADYALDQLLDSDEYELAMIGRSRVFSRTEIPCHCPACGAAMVERRGKFGPFIGCSAFPKCKKGPTFSINDPGLSEEDQAIIDGELPPRE